MGSPGPAKGSYVITYMIQVQRQTIANDLLAEAQLYVDHPDKITDFGLKKLERGATDLAKVDAATAHAVRAAIASIKWDVEGVDYWTRNALSLDRSFNMLTNSAVSKAFVCDFFGAADLALESLKLANSDPKVAFNVCSALMFAGRFDEVLEISGRFTSKTKEFEDMENNAADALSGIKLLGIRHDEVKRQLEIGTLVAREHRVRIKAIEAGCVEDFEDGKSFVVSLNFIGDIHQEIEMDETLVEKFADDPEWNPLKLSIEFRYLTKDELPSE